MLGDKIENWLEYNHSRKVKGLEYVGSSNLSIGTTLGLVRKQNEDRLVFFKSRFFGKSYSGAILCDGMGGMDSGGRCASMAISNFINSFSQSKLSSLKDRVNFAVTQANEMVRKSLKGKGGTTIVGFINEEFGKSICFNVGDSRAYLFSPEEFRQITKDDTIDGHLANVKEKIDPKILRSNQLLQYIGMDEIPQVHTYEFQEALKTQRIILTSDGAHNIGNELLQSLTLNSTDSSDLTRKVLWLADWIGGKDNASMITFNMHDFVSYNHTRSGSNIDPNLEVWSFFGKLEILFTNTSENTNPTEKVKNQYKNKPNNNKQKKPKIPKPYVKYQEKTGKTVQKPGVTEVEEIEPKGSSDDEQLKIKFS